MRTETWTHAVPLDQVKIKQQSAGTLARTARLAIELATTFSDDAGNANELATELATTRAMQQRPERLTRKRWFLS